MQIKVFNATIKLSLVGQLTFLSTPEILLDSFLLFFAQ